MKLSKSFIVAIISFTLSVFAAFFELKSFESWGQVTRLWEDEVNPLSNLLHPHMPRYLIVYPGFLLDEYGAGFGFSVYITVFFTFNMLLLRKVSLLANRCPPSLTIYLIFAAIHFAMNGRGVIVWTAWLICIWVCLKITKKISTPANQLFWIALSCLLATVSTGVFVIVLLAFAFVMMRYLKLPKRSSMIQLLVILPVATSLGFVVLDYFLIAVNKNLEFYGGGVDGIFSMLKHGVGIIFYEVNMFGMMILIFVLICAFFVMLSLIAVRIFSLLDYFILLSIVGGLFGFTVLTLILPPLLLKIQFALKYFNGVHRQKTSLIL
jgi:hypothetical protein